MLPLLILLETKRTAELSLRCPASNDEKIKEKTAKYEKKKKNQKEIYRLVKTMAKSNIQTSREMPTYTYTVHATTMLQVLRLLQPNQITTWKKIKLKMRLANILFAEWR